MGEKHWTNFRVWKYVCENEKRRDRERKTEKSEYGKYKRIAKEKLAHIVWEHRCIKAVDRDFEKYVYVLLFLLLWPFGVCEFHNRDLCTLIDRRKQRTNALLKQNKRLAFLQVIGFWKTTSAEKKNSIISQFDQIL